eukprot:6210915-Pleurochrysis_carterae.AAC.1
MRPGILQALHENSRRLTLEARWFSVDTVWAFSEHLCVLYEPFALSDQSWFTRELVRLKLSSRSFATSPSLSPEIWFFFASSTCSRHAKFGSFSRHPHVRDMRNLVRFRETASSSRSLRIWTRAPHALAPSTLLSSGQGAARPSAGRARQLPGRRHHGQGLHRGDQSLAARSVSDAP